MAGFMLLRLHRPRLDTQVKSLFAITLPDFYILCYEAAVGAFPYSADTYWPSLFIEDKKAIKLALINSGSREYFLTNLRKVVPLLKKDVISDHYGWKYE